MHEFFTVTKEEIGILSDAQLRVIVADLCRSELRKYELETAGVTAGGAQTAPDGGIDVMVRLSQRLPHTDGFIKQPITGFQVKKSGMEAADIKKEMRPNGDLRDSIKTIGAQKGAYIIASGKSDVTDSMLQARLKAMKDALGDVECEVYFYDGDQIANWVSENPSIVVKVKSLVGRPIEGWEPYGEWSAYPGISAYILDDHTRIINLRTNEVIRGNDAIDTVRTDLQQPGRRIRIVGLSGVGKTRFVQALFEQQVRDLSALPTDAVIYTPNRDLQSPTPTNLLEQVSRTHARTILVIDNCDHKTHGNLSRHIARLQSPVSLLTVEHDLEDNLPEETNAYKLEPGSEETIKTVIARKYPEFLPVKINKIVELSSGNFRVALVLADALQHNDNISDITDKELFERIFYQNGRKDEVTYRSAQALSLLYSFDFSKQDEYSEIGLLGKLVGLDEDQMYRSVRRLESIDLIQSRGDWRAILPHAMANRLAQQCLSEIRPSKIIATLNDSRNERMFKSFANRVGFLPGNPAVKEIVDHWLSVGGQLRNAGTYSHNKITALRNVVLVRQAPVLELIDEWINDANSMNYLREKNCLTSLLDILGYIAYSNDHFSHALNLMLQVFSFQQVNSLRQKTPDRIATFFQVHFSGSVASLQTRVSLLNSWILDSRIEDRIIVKCLKYSLKTQNFTRQSYFDRSKGRTDYGYAPQTNVELVGWWKGFFEVLFLLYEKRQNGSELMSEVFEATFHNLWMKCSATHDSFDKLIRKVVEQYGQWEKARDVVNRILSRNEGKAIRGRNKLIELQKLLAPHTLVDKIKAVVMWSMHDRPPYLLDVSADSIDVQRENFKDASYALGVRCAEELHILNQILPQLIDTFNYDTVPSFANGIASLEASLRTSVEIVFQYLEQQAQPLEYYTFPKELIARYVETDPTAYHKLMDNAMRNGVMRVHLIPLQCGHEQSLKDIERLDLLIGDTDIPASQYKFLAPILTDLPEELLVKFISTVSRAEGGLRIAMSSLHDLIGRSGVPYVPNEHLQTLGLELTVQFTSIALASPASNFDHIYMITAIKTFFKGSEADDSVCQILAKIKSLYEIKWSLSYEAEQIITSLLESFPTLILEVFVRTVDFSGDWIHSNTCFPDAIRKFITKLPGDEVIKWCESDPYKRYLQLSFCISPFTDRRGVEVTPNWTVIVSAILHNSKDTERCLSIYRGSIFATNSAGNSLIEQFEALSPLLIPLQGHDKRVVRDWIDEIQTEIRDGISKAQKWEKESNWHREEPAFE